MQLQLQLLGMVLDPAPKVWNQLDPDAQKAVVQALTAATVKVINHKVEQKNESGENKDD
jgi:TRAP-type C4-dicarboxylate transport system substrate-binding protein